MKRLSLLLIGTFVFAPTSTMAAQLEPRVPWPTRFPELSPDIAEKRFAVHDKGLQWLGMANNGEFSNPDHVEDHWVPMLEYPGGSETLFLFSGGIWIGALVDGRPLVSTTTDGNDGTNEFGGLEFATTADSTDPLVRSIGWLERTREHATELDQIRARVEGRYLGFGIWRTDDDGDWHISMDVDGNGVPSSDFDGIFGRDDDGDGIADEEILNARDDDGDGLVDEDVGRIDVEWAQTNSMALPYLNDDYSKIQPGDANGDGDPSYDPEPHIDEDPSGDISRDFLDNDFDGLIDHEDPDFDGDAVIDDIDDDGDGFFDEDDASRATHELITAYVDTCSLCVNNADVDGHTPLGLRVVQHSYQWCEPDFDDFIIMDFLVTNVGDNHLTSIHFGAFFDSDIRNTHDLGPSCGEDDITYYIEDLRLAVGGNDDWDEGCIVARTFGVKILTPAPTVLQSTYRNFSRLVGGGDPADNEEKYAELSSTERSPDQYTPSDWRILLGTGPFESLNPGETLVFTVVLANGVEEEDLIAHVERSSLIEGASRSLGRIPDAPLMSVEPVEDGAIVKWRSNAELCFEHILDRSDFQGYSIWRTQDGESWTLVATYDLPDSIALNAGWPPPESGESQYDYELEDSGLAIGAPYTYAVTAFDDGDNGDGIHSIEWDNRNCSIGVLESPRHADPDLTIHTAILAADEGNVQNVYVVPNPYVGSSQLLQAPWTIDPETYPRERHLEFRNLPGTSTIQIFTLGGDLVQTIKHTNGESWEPWDLRGRDGDQVTAGIYLYRVASAGNEHIGKFIVVR